jgi:chaperone BCS1
MLDPVLSRPRRLDLHIELRLASRYQARVLRRRFYVPDVLEHVTEDGDDENNDVAGESGYATPTQGGCDSLPSVPKGVGIEDPAPKYNGSTHSVRELSGKKIEQFAEQFSSRVPKRELSMSMASLQGYLMS